jgi:hypothetical protein
MPAAGSKGLLTKMTTGASAKIWGERREGWKAGKADARDTAATDYGRIVHSASFRRLQGKTQILNLGDSDFYRNRLTHSIEVCGSHRCHSEPALFATAFVVIVFPPLP